MKLYAEINLYLLFLFPIVILKHMKNFWVRFLVFCSALLFSLFASCSSDGSDETDKAPSRDAALLAASKMPAIGPDRVEVVWYKTVMFSSGDSADIYQLAHIISQEEKDSIKACMERKFDRVKHGQKIHRRTCIHRELCGDDNLRINFYRGENLKEEILFWNEQAPYALKEFLDKKGVMISGAIYAPDTSRKKTGDDLFDRVKSLPDSQPLVGGQVAICKSVIRTTALSDMKTTPAVDDSIKVKIRKVLAQRTPGIRHLRNKYAKKFPKEYPEDVLPEDLLISMTLNQGGAVYSVKARFAEAPNMESGFQKIYDDYLKEVENSMRRWVFPPTGLKKVEFPLYTSYK